jgi:predicted nucleic acid-binding protein
MRTLMRKYADQPMDLVDAALVAVAERDGIDCIFTVHKNDFLVYRIHNRLRFKVIP